MNRSINELTCLYKESVKDDKFEEFVSSLSEDELIEFVGNIFVKKLEVSETEKKYLVDVLALKIKEDEINKSKEKMYVELEKIMNDINWEHNHINR